jgi:KUP system potassium uptake protein
VAPPRHGRLRRILRLTVVHTSSKTEGQIYIPEMNYLLMVACVALVVQFRTSSALAATYGTAVTATMAIDSYLFYLVCVHRWSISRGRALTMLASFISIDLAFFAGNAVKIPDGGWFPLAVGALVFAVMTTWWRGRIDLQHTMEAGTLAADLFLADLDSSKMPRVRGTAVFMASNTDGIPNVLLHHVKHNQVLHEQVVLLSIVTEAIPWVSSERALTVKNLGNGFYRVIARVGFSQSPDAPDFLGRCSYHGLAIQPATTTYYLGRQTLLTGGKGRMALWRKILFSFLSRNSRPPTAFFHLPPNRVVELGLQIEL